MVSPIEIAGRKVGPGHPCLIVAEAGVNHTGRLELACKLVDVAVEARADVVKFQSFRAEEVVTPSGPKAEYQLRTTDRDESQLEMLRRLELSEEAHQLLWEHCRKRNILFLSTPFSERSADLLHRLGVAAFKIPSGELTNLPLLAHVARKGKPMIVSTGMATLAEVRVAVETIRDAGDPPLALLHCLSSYPADPAEANLRAMETMTRAFQVPVGYSDHTPGIEVALAAVALGACVIEKHLTLDRSLPGPDHRASLEPGELAALVRGIRLIEAAMGDGQKEPTPHEREVAAAARRSLVAARDIPEGSPLTEDLIAIKRPGTGLPPVLRSQLMGRITKEPVRAGTVLTWEMLK